MKCNLQIIEGNNLPELVTDESIEAKLLQLVNNKDAFSKNTWRNIISSMRIWGRFATERGYAWFPAIPDQLREWMDYADKVEGLGYNSIKARISSMNVFYKHMGQPIPTSHSVINLGLRIIRRQHVFDGEVQGQAIPFRRVDLDALVESWQGSKQLAQLRDLAFMAVAYNTLLRLSEVARIKVRDIVFYPDGSARIEVNHTKTMLSTSGIVKSLAPYSAQIVKRWLEAARLFDQPDKCVFCRVHRVNKAIHSETAMSNSNTVQIFERAWFALNDHTEAANKGRYETWTGHSARVGGALDLLEAGANLEQIMLEGNWSNPEMVLHYLRHALAGKSLLSKLLMGD